MFKFDKEYDEVENVWKIIEIIQDMPDSVLFCFESEDMADLMLFCLDRRIK